MKNVILIFALLGMNHFVFSQNFDFLVYSEEEIIESLNSDLDSSAFELRYNLDTIYEPKIDGVLVDMEDIDTNRDFTLIQNNNQLDSVEFFFKRPYEICDSIVLHYCCDSCADAHWKTYLESYKDKLITKINSNQFYVRDKRFIYKDINSEQRFGVPFLQKRKDKSKNEILLIFYFDFIDKKTWKKLKKGDLLKKQP